MKNYLGRIILLVEDYEPAAEFYEKNFGFKKIFDVKTDVGQRFLHIASDPLDSAGIWFLKAESKDQRLRVGNQTAGQPTMVIYTTSLNETFELLGKNGVRVTVKPVLTPAYKYLHCLDLYGNEIVVVEIDS
jgi:predicted enzyme related to lactoylglutathione lyase